RAVVISSRLWHQQFDGDESVLGTTISLEGKSHMIVGVMHPEIEFPVSDVDVWMPLDPATDSRYFLKAIARMKDGVTLATVQTAMNILAEQIRREDPQSNANVMIDAASWRQNVEPTYELTMTLIFA